MNLPWRLKILAGRLRRRRTAPAPDREEVVRRHAAGKSFCDVGCMWNVHGRIAFVAEEAGASRVTGVDVMGATTEFEAEHERRGSSVRYVNGDLHDPATAADVGPHEVVWCSGVLYHSPNPVLTLERLRELTTQTLILQTVTVPELPGVAQGLVFYPGLPEREKRLYRLWGDTAEGGLASPHASESRYSPWWWGISPSALRGMLGSVGFEITEEWGDPFGLHVVAHPR
jgi:methyltransferase family protein